MLLLTVAIFNKTAGMWDGSGGVNQGVPAICDGFRLGIAGAQCDGVIFDAICEVVIRPSMRFVPVKATEQQVALALHRTRDLLVKQRTQLVNMIRGLLAEFGIEMARGLRHALELAGRLLAGDAAEVPSLAQRVVTGLADQIGALQIQLTRLERGLLA